MSGATRVSVAGALCLLATLAACEKIPPDRYGVERVRVEGTEQMDDDALKNCLLTRERDRFGITLGISEAGPCGEPPVDGRRKHLHLFSMPWTQWPLYDGLALQKDMDRVVRWYEARGFHHARVVGYDVEPEQARDEDTIPKEGDPGCERHDEDEGCLVRVLITVEEGEPTITREVVLDGLEGLDEEVREELREAVVVAEGERFDEERFDTSKEALAEVLGKYGYAKARVRGKARVDRAAREARVSFGLVPGPKCVFGEVTVSGTEDYLREAVKATTLVRPGDPFSTDVLRDIRQAVFGMTLFSSVVIEPKTHEDDNRVDVHIELQDLPRNRFGAGIGIQAGVVNRGDGWGESISVPQWDVHLVSRYTRNRVLRGPRRFKLEDRPAMIIQEQFPSANRPRFGNRISMELTQMGIFEPRIQGTIDTSYDYGPDYFDTFFRHRVDAGLTFSRFFFFRRVLELALGNRQSIYRVNQCLDDGMGAMPPAGRRSCELTNDGAIPPADYELNYLVERIRLDLRDNDVKPHKGFMFLTEAQQALFPGVSSWRYIRLTPDFRFYIPLPAEITVALRFALGAYFIRHADADLDELSRQLGPRELRLRGGGASSNRGFAPGQLGDGDEGGIRRWESSLEWRFTVSPHIGITTFIDAGDVSRTAPFRFNIPQMSAGFGFRVFTPVGPLRFDLGWRLPGLQVFGEDTRTGEGEVSRFPGGRPGAFHFSIAEAF